MRVIVYGCMSHGLRGRIIRQIKAEKWRLMQVMMTRGAPADWTHVLVIAITLADLSSEKTKD